MQSDMNYGQIPPSQPSGQEQPSTSPPPLGPSFPPPRPSVQPDGGQRFGGAPVEPPPPQTPRKRRPMLTCLVVLVVLGIVGFAIIAILMNQLGGIIQGEPIYVKTSSDTVGLVRIDGVIMDDRKVLEVIDHYAEKKDIHAILVRIDSPGGGVGPSQEIYEAVQRLREDGKKVVVSMGSVAASGGYYVACAADEIYTNPGTLTGSIGVIIGIPNFKAIADKIGIDYQVVKSGKFKDIGSATRALTQEERDLMQGLINDVYNQFVEAILDNREEQIGEALTELSDDEVTSLTGKSKTANAEEFLRAIADGRILTGRQAVRYGLADDEGTQQDAFDRVAQLAGIHKPRLYEYKPRRPLSEIFEASAQSVLKGVGLPVEGMRIEYRMPY